MSTTERFTVADFESALASSVGGHESHIRQEGYIGGELRYSYLVKELDDDEVRISINSSITKNGIAAGTGENSIRAWLTDKGGHPLGSKTQKWVTRQPGWQTRLSKMVGELVNMAVKIESCPECGETEHVYKVRKDGENKGRYFKKCPYDHTFVWLDSYIPEAPECPQCGMSMVIRDGKYGEFWGCQQYPDCRGTRSVERDENGDIKGTVKEVIENLHEREDKRKADQLDFVPSKYQMDIFEWVMDREPGDHLIVNALAGSGKTTTGLKMLEFTMGLDVLFVAFNKAIQEELADRAPSNVSVKTYHALGFAACRDAYELDIDDVEERKVYRLLKKMMDKDKYGPLFPTIRKLISLVKANLSDTDDESLYDLSDYYGVELNGDSDVIFQAVRKVVARCASDTSTVDFDDMCWLPVLHDLPMRKYDVVFVDEAQDTNKNQIELALKAVKEQGSIIAVGDDFQSIYGFRGADAQAIPNLLERLDADELPLSITYRCPPKVVDLVNRKFPEIPLEVWEDHPYEGRVLSWTRGEALSEWEEGDMVLCRVNAPLVRPCFDLIRKGVKATIRGRDIGEGLVNLIDKMDARDVRDLIKELHKYKQEEVSKLLDAEKNNQARSLEDKVDTLLALSDGVYEISTLKERIEDVFSNDGEGVVFSSIHKAKGLEAERISILRSDLMPHPHAEKPWELEQERNIEYVALTRSKKDLVFVL